MSMSVLPKSHSAQRTKFAIISPEELRVSAQAIDTAVIAPSVSNACFPECSYALDVSILVLHRQPAI